MSWTASSDICVDLVDRWELLGLASALPPRYSWHCPLWDIVVDYAVRFSTCDTRITPLQGESVVAVEFNTRNVTGILHFDLASRLVSLRSIQFNPYLARGSIRSNQDMEWAERYERTPFAKLNWWWRGIYRSSSLACITEIIERLKEDAVVIKDKNLGKLCLKSTIPGRLPSQYWIFQPHAITTICHELALTNSCIVTLLNRLQIVYRLI